MDVISDSSMYLYKTNIAKGLSAAWSLDAGKVEMVILTLQCDMNLKTHQGAPNVWCLVDTENFKGVCTVAMKVACLFGLLCLSESVFSDTNFIKNKRRTHLTDVRLWDLTRIVVSCYSIFRITLHGPARKAKPRTKRPHRNLKMFDFEIPII